ncbi:MAG: hypothetical protein RL166_633 [Actinomycetota bacterium]|jgi:ABC-type phosphate transport system substrate-binding protein
MKGTALKRKSFRKIQVATGLALCATLITACDPPMPPELLAQLAEQSYTCYEGDTTALAESTNEAIVSTLAESLSAACTGELPQMTMSAAENEASADMVISASPVSECRPFAKVPYGFDAGVVAYNVEGTDSLNLSYKNLAAVLNGQITQWNDQALAKDNPDLTLPDVEILVRKVADRNSLRALATALEYQSATLDEGQFETTNFFDGTVPEELQPGEIAIVPNSVAVANGYSSIGLLSGKKDPETGEKLFANATEESLYAAGTQLVSESGKNEISVYVDPKVAVKAMFEGEAPSVPYQAIFPLNLYLCGEDTKLKRAVAAFVLRLDSQGALGYLNISQLPESIRYSSVGLVRQGLPVPKVSKKSE